MLAQRRSGKKYFYSPPVQHPINSVTQQQVKQNTASLLKQPLSSHWLATKL